MIPNHEIADPEDVLWVCPGRTNTARCFGCPCNNPHFEDDCLCPYSDCPECEPMDQFKAEEALSYIPIDWSNYLHSAMQEGMLYNVNRSLLFQKFGESKPLPDYNPNSSIKLRWHGGKDDKND